MDPLFDVFISYSHEDVEWARWLYDRLTARGLSVFLDEAVLRFGDNFPAKIEQSLEHSLAVLLLLSRQSQDSAWIKFESTFNWTATFLDSERKLIPVIIEKGCDIPARLKNLLSCEFTDKDDFAVGSLVSALLSRKNLDVGTYHLDRVQRLPEELVKNIVECVKRYFRPAADRLLLLESAVTELVDNAFRHTSKGRVSLRVQATEKSAEVTVCDAGVGFDLRGTLIRSGQLLDDQPSIVGGRGLTLLVARGVRLLNKMRDDGRHCINAIIWWHSADRGAPDDRVSVDARGNGCLTVTLSGRLDNYTCDVVEAALLTYAYDPKTNGIVFDLAGVDYVSSLALRTLLSIANVARTNRYEVVVAALQPLVAEIFRISRTDRIYTVFESREQAEAAIDAGLQKRAPLTHP